MADSDACKLCLSTASAVDQQIVCFGTLLPAAASSGTEDGTRIKCTVAEILTKHFWFEVCALGLINNCVFSKFFVQMRLFFIVTMRQRCGCIRLPAMLDKSL